MLRVIHECTEYPTNGSSIITDSEVDLNQAQIRRMFPARLSRKRRFLIDAFRDHLIDTSVALAQVFVTPYRLHCR